MNHYQQKYRALLDELLSEINTELKRIKRQVLFRDLQGDQARYLDGLFGEKFCALGLNGEGETIVITCEPGAECSPLGQIRFMKHLSVDHIHMIIDQLSSIPSWANCIFRLKHKRTGQITSFTIADLTMLWENEDSVYDHINEERYELISTGQLYNYERNYIQQNFLGNTFFGIPGTPAVVCIRQELQATDLSAWSRCFA